MPAPKRRYPTVPLSADPDFRLAQRSWERFSTQRPRGKQTPQIEMDLDSGDKNTRADAEKAVSASLAELLVAASIWALKNPNADVEQEIGSGMLPAINWLVRVLKIPTTVAPLAQSKEVEARRRPGDQRPGTKDRVLSEGVPPCWSPRWSEQRQLLRSVPPSRMAAGEFYTFFLSLVPRIQDLVSTYSADGELHPEIGARAARRILAGSPALAREPLGEAQRDLRFAELELTRLQSDPNARIRLTQARAAVRQRQAALAALAESIESGLSMSIPAFIEKQYQRFASVEVASENEKRQILNKAQQLSKQRNLAWGILNKRRKPRTPREQNAALEAMLEGGEEEDDVMEPPDIDFDEYI
jgi:hypothetical protein